MKFPSFAKINIGLKVVEKRPDGYHNIETFFQQIDLGDFLDIEPTMDGRIHITTSDAACPADATNLAWRAADLLRTFVEEPILGCRIHIDKKIPMGAGLGGGSSNAAVTLTALNRLWQCSLSDDEQSQLAARLGSDVPFFLRGGLAFGTGRGEILQPLPDRPDYYGLLLFPGVHISTAWVYNNLNFTLTKSDNFPNFAGFKFKVHDLSSWKSIFKNDLSSVVFTRHPEFGQVLESFYNLGAFYAQMSGSGSALFGLYQTQKEAAKAAQFFKNNKTYLFRPVY